MTSRRDYRRQIIMMNEVDDGYGIDAGMRPAGYTRIEIKGGNGVLASFVQNLKHLMEEGRVYKGFIASTGERPLLLSTGAIVIDERGKGEKVWRFDPGDVEGTGCGIEDFDLFGVMVHKTGDKTREFHCPLAGGAGGLRQGWRNIIQQHCFGEKYKPAPLMMEEIVEEATRPESQEGSGPSTPQAVNQEHAVEEQAVQAQETEGFVVRGFRDIAQPASVTEAETDERIPRGHSDVIYNIGGGFEGGADFDLEGYMEDVLKCYRKVDPFREPIRDCVWWRINEYNYLFGIMYGDDGKLRYYIYGVPGAYDSMAEKQMEAFGFNHWHPVEGTGGSKCGYGYWLAFVDAVTGALAKPEIKGMYL